ncbi:MAG: glycosyltransferase family 2 protein [Chloroflexota bacterium]
MNIIFSIFTILFWGIGSVLAVWVGYLLLLTVCAWFTPSSTKPPTKSPQNRFAILIPAHNEEKLLPGLLANLAQLDYPKELYDIFVVADNCMDNTASLARATGSIVYERFDTKNVGKGCALQWLLGQILDDDRDFDAATILDADSLVSSNFLRIMDAKLQQGALAIQAYYAVRDAEQSWTASLRASALAVLHYLRPQGRMLLGASAGLKGNGMVFHKSILVEYKWSASVTEDIEYHMSLILGGQRVLFAPDAVVWAEIPNSLSESNTQNVRWEQGRLEMAKVYVPRLLKRIFLPGPNLGSRFVLFDAVMEHIIPPFSILLGLSGISLILALLIDTTASVNLVTFIFVGQFIYLTSGMVLADVPRKAYLAMFYLPLFLGWKIWLYVRLFVRPEKKGWVRTRRIGEQQ